MPTNKRLTHYTIAAILVAAAAFVSSWLLIGHVAITEVNLVSFKKRDYDYYAMPWFGQIRISSIDCVESGYDFGAYACDTHSPAEISDAWTLASHTSFGSTGTGSAHPLWVYIYATSERAERIHEWSELDPQRARVFWCMIQDLASRGEIAAAAHLVNSLTHSDVSDEEFRITISKFRRG